MQQTSKPETTETMKPPAVPAAVDRRVLHRLRRAQGQLAAVIAAVEDSRPCREVVMQLAAVSSALDRAGVVYLSNAMQECLSTPAELRAEGDPSPDEFEKLLLMLT